MNSVKSNKLSLKYERFTSSGYKIQGLENLSLWQRLNSFQGKKADCIKGIESLSQALIL